MGCPQTRHVVDPDGVSSAVVVAHRVTGEPGGHLLGWMDTDVDGDSITPNVEDRVQLDVVRC